MYQPIKEILVATSLSGSFVSALETAAFIAIPYQASLVLMCYYEEDPTTTIRHVKRLIGEKRLNEICLKHNMIPWGGCATKKNVVKIVQVALKHFVSMCGIDDGCLCTLRKIIVVERDLVDKIIEQTTENKHDLILMAAVEGSSSHEHLEQVVASVVNATNTPVMIVPDNGRPR